MNLAEILQSAAASEPTTAAIIDLRGRSGRPRVLTFADLAEGASRGAAALAEAGLEPGATALLLQPMSADLYVALLAILHAGLVAMFPDPSAGVSSLRDACRRRPPDVLVGRPTANALGLVVPQLRRIPRRFTVGRALPGIRSLAITTARPRSARPTPRSSDAPALLTFTSGSTERPKAVLRTHGFLLAQYHALEDNLGLEPGEVDLTTLPVFLLANLAAGVTSVLPDVDLRHPGTVRPDRLVAAIRAHAVTRTAASPALLERLAEHCLARGIQLRTLRKVFTGGAPVFPRVLEKLRRVAPEARVGAVYGSTEAEPIAHLDADGVREVDLSAMYAGGGLLAGTPVPAVHLRILADQWGQALLALDPDTLDRLTLPPGAPGEIVVRGDHVLRGYLDGEGEERTKIRTGDDVWHRTGDAGHLDEGGRLWLLGRCGTRVGTGSDARYPLAVECAASRFPWVRRSAFFEDPENRRVLAVETDEPHPPIGELERSLAWADLDGVRIVRAIPVDARHNAKIDYRKLRRTSPRRAGIAWPSSPLTRRAAGVPADRSGPDAPLGS